MSRSRKPQNYAEIAGRTFLFSGIPEQEVQTLLSSDGVTVAHFAAGESIYAPSEFQKQLGIVLSGSANVEKRAGDASMLMSVLKTGDLFGAAAMFSDEAVYVTDITAHESTWTLLIPEAAMKDMMQSDFRVTENYLRYLTGRIRFLSGRIDGFVQPNVEDRLLLFLRKNAKDGVFSPDYSLSKLADTLCVSRATLYRALDALVKRGSIRREEKTIVLSEERENP